ncbi:hypothetical protein [Halomicrococcus sp. SG-WS-1]|uniref:hypothetical protein n=1 Tax=Halomicrococcus sp. SG-WS-1 TaxID=3439057 RepID=UPI003F7AFA6A
MRRTLVLWFVVGVLLAATTPTTVAQERSCAELLREGTVTSEPGEQLADVVGAQESAVETQINDRWFDARLANATTVEERADIVSDERERIEERLETLGDCRRQLGERRRNDAVGEETVRRWLDGLETRSAVLHRRVNETAVEAGRLPATAREEHDLTPEALTDLERRIVELRESLEETAGTTTPG